MKATGSFAAIRKDAAFWSANVFGTLTAAASIISIVQHLFDISLVPAFARGLLAYRYIAHTVTDWVLAPFVYAIETLSIWLQYPLVIDTPDWWIDLTIISLVSSGAAIRSILITLRVRSIALKQLLGISVLTIIFGITMFGVIWLIIGTFHLVSKMRGNKPRYTPDSYNDPDGLHEKAAAVAQSYYEISIFAVVLASAGFFLVNHFVL